MNQESRAVPRLLLILTLFLAPSTCLVGALRPTPVAIAAHGISQRWPAGDTVDVCAIRVEFVPDNATGTTGDGTMGSAFHDSLLIDPKPHDRAYFEDHLKFLEHYYETVSKNALPFGRLDVFPVKEDSVYRVAHPMWHYNYNIDDDLLNQRLTELFLEALQLADIDVNFADYDAVIIFHAGVGKDFNIGYDDTPFDLPSAYITASDFQKYLPDHPYGFQTNDVVVVDRGVMLPEGESQEGYELGLNGIMVKLFGNWLGLPDLFNTQTGRSGIGRWGMMDQGSGNVIALVPAMPEAWSRVYMGWEIPDTIWASDESETLQVRRFNVSNSAPEILLLPITETEYYLIENRAADPDNRRYVECRDREGHIMQISLYGDTIAISPEGFRVAIKADNYDFGIPGDGLLIWHIDETKIRAGLDNNTVNRDPEHRGVDLVEADGAQDIGEEYGFGYAGGGTELGAPEDAWWDDNDYHKEANGNVIHVAFNNKTFPAARTHDYAFSWYELSDFSAISSVMSFAVRNRTRIPGFPIEVPLAPECSLSVFPGDLNGDGLAELIVADGDHTIYFTDTTTTLRAMSAPVWSRIHIADIDGSGQDAILFAGNQLIIFKNVMEPHPLVYASNPLPTSETYTQLCIGAAPDGSARILSIRDRIGRTERSESGNEYSIGLALFDSEANLLDTLAFPSDTVWQVSGVVALEPAPSTSWVIGYGATGRGELLVAIDLSDEVEVRWQKQEENGLKPLACVATEAETLLWCEGGWRSLHSGEFIREAACPFSYQIIDWDGDGAPEVINESRACHLQSGFPVEEFPVQASVQNVVTADFDGDGSPDFLGDDGQWHIFRHRLTEPPSFPIARLGSLKFIFHWDTEAQIEMATLFSPLYFAEDKPLLDLRRITAGGAPGYRRIYNAYPEPFLQDPNPTFFYSIDPGVGTQVYARSDWVYPWPNPTNHISNIRLTLSYAAQTHIRFFDIAGHQIDELSNIAVGPGPFDVPWDVSGVASGVYVAVVEVVGNGKTERTQIKIAVVK